MSMSDNYEEYAPYRWHPCKQLEDTEIEECTAEEADFFGVYMRDEDTHLLQHLFDCVSKYDAKKACSLLEASHAQLEDTIWDYKDTGLGRSN